MSGINYDLKKIKGMVFDVDGVLSCSSIPLHPSGEPMRIINIKDGYALQLAVKLGYNIAIITGANTEAVRIRFESLGIKDVYTSVKVKMPVLQEWMQKHSLMPDEVMYMGDDIPDYQVMEYVGLPIAPNDAATDIKNIALYITPQNGGYGCGRDVIEQILRAQDRWVLNKTSFGW